MRLRSKCFSTWAALLVVGVGAPAMGLGAQSTSGRVDVDRETPTLTLGIDAEVSSITYLNPGVNEKFTSVQAPTPRLRIELRASPQLSIQLPVSLTLRSGGGTYANGSVGFLPLYYFGSDASATRAFLSAGPVLDFATGSGAYGSQVLVRAEGGFAVPMGDNIAFRPAVFYDHGLSSKTGDISNGFGLALGLNLGVPVSRSDDTDWPPLGRNELRIGASLTHSAVSFNGFSGADSYSAFQLPSEYVGYFYTPGGPDGRVSLGSNLSFLSASGDGSSEYVVQAQPAVEFTLRQPRAGEAGFRVGARYDLTYDHFGSIDGSTTTNGYGATADLLFLRAGGYMMSAGASFDHTLSQTFDPTVNSIGVNLAIGKRW